MWRSLRISPKSFKWSLCRSSKILEGFFFKDFHQGWLQALLAIGSSVSLPLTAKSYFKKYSKKYPAVVTYTISLSNNIIQTFSFFLCLLPGSLISFLQPSTTKWTSGTCYKKETVSEVSTRLELRFLSHDDEINRNTFWMSGVLCFFPFRW